MGCYDSSLCKATARARTDIARRYDVLSNLCHTGADMQTSKGILLGPVEDGKELFSNVNE